MSTSAFAFRELTGVDPASVGDPFVRVRFRHGMLLGADDFTVEQRAHLLRHRVHQALLHGAGTVWGLAVAAQTVQERPELTLAPGLAVDAMGREIYVDKAQCLDLSAIFLHPRWKAMEAVSAATPDRRRAYVVLRHQACESDPVPAVRPPGIAGETFSRVLDHFRVDLEAKPPDDPAALLRRFLGREDTPTAEGVSSLRDAIAALTLGPAEALSGLWDGDEEAPLLLAAVVIDVSGGVVSVSGAPDNRVRAFLPMAAVLWEQILGQRLSGADASQRARVRAAGVVQTATGRALQVDFTAPILEKTIGSAVRLLALGDGGWTRLAATAGLSADGATLLIAPDDALASGTKVQLLLIGQGEAPILGVDHQPLAGWWDEPTPAAGRGLDASFVGVWEVLS